MRSLQKPAFLTELAAAGGDPLIEVTPFSTQTPQAHSHPMSFSTTAGPYSGGKSAAKFHIPSVLCDPDLEDKVVVSDDEEDGESSTPSITAVDYPGIDRSVPLSHCPVYLAAPQRVMAMPSKVVQRAILLVVSREPMPVQVRFDDSVQQMVKSQEFETMVRAGVWYVVSHLQKRQTATSSANVTTKSEEIKTIESEAFHVCAMCYGRLFMNYKPPPMSHAKALEHKDSVFDFIPLIVPKASFYLASSIFSRAEDEGRFDAALRETLWRNFKEWTTGVPPEHPHTPGWAQYQRRKRIVKWHREFCPEQMAKNMDSVLRRTSLGGMSQQPLVLAVPVEGVTPRVGASLAPSATSPSFRRTAHTSHQQQRNATTSATPVAAAGSGAVSVGAPSPRVVVPTLSSHCGRWFEFGATRGFLSVERAEERRTPGQELRSTVKQSPFVAHYLAQLQVEVKVPGGGRKDHFKFTLLSTLDKQRKRMGFTSHSSNSSRAAAEAVALAKRTRDAVIEMELKSVIVGQRMRQYWEGKTRFANDLIRNMYSQFYPPTRQKAATIQQSLHRALAEHGSSIFDNIECYKATLAQVEEEIFTIPLPKRQELHEMALKAGLRLRTLLRKAPSTLDIEREEKKFLETTTFRPQSLQQLDAVFSQLSKSQTVKEEELESFLTSTLGAAELPRIDVTRALKGNKTNKKKKQEKEEKDAAVASAVTPPLRGDEEDGGVTFPDVRYKETPADDAEGPKELLATGNRFEILKVYNETHFEEKDEGAIKSRGAEEEEEEEDEEQEEEKEESFNLLEELRKQKRSEQLPPCEIREGGHVSSARNRAAACGAADSSRGTNRRAQGGGSGDAASGVSPPPQRCLETPSGLKLPSTALDQLPSLSGTLGPGGGGGNITGTPSTARNWTPSKPKLALGGSATPRPTSRFTPSMISRIPVAPGSSF